jgi:hypothetical protein
VPKAAAKVAPDEDDEELMMGSHLGFWVEIVCEVYTAATENLQRLLGFIEVVDAVATACIAVTIAKS